MKTSALYFVLFALILSSCRYNLTKTDTNEQDSTQTILQTDSINASKGKITEDMAYQGVCNYCHSKYDWSVAEENPSMMYVQRGEETVTEYQVIFRSYTGAFVYFYVDKSSGATRMIEYVPTLNVKNEAGTINLFDYLKK